jgi:hypothetical protein
MVGIPSPFGTSDDDLFDPYGAFVPENVPEPGRFLAGHDVLTGRDHLAFHRLTRELFEERTVYDMTFGYNLARLNLDQRHSDAGYRYAVERGGDDAVATDESVLRAAFTPTTPFCPQSHTLTTGSFRAWNGLSERHEYDLVRVRVDPMHNRAGEINERLRGLEETYLETGEIPAESANDTESNPLAEAVDDEESVPETPF